MSEPTGAMRDAEKPAPCPYCRTVNDFVFTYCRNCLEKLPANPNPVVDGDRSR